MPLNTLNPKCSENYTFYLNADDRLRLWVDAKLLLDRPQTHSYGPYYSFWMRT
ncbi:PA14 domain-containing protein [Paenibacillus sp. FSL K6-2859]|uniref:PA14 domain-containing protein n=1 Tax=Paenibacillus sp. FSL K6-2859 TaxID=2921482 RepID=UPI004046C38A